MPVKRVLLVIDKILAILGLIEVYCYTYFLLSPSEKSSCRLNFFLDLSGSANFDINEAITLTLKHPGGGIKTTAIRSLAIASMIKLGVSNLHVIFTLGV